MAENKAYIVSFSGGLGSWMARLFDDYNFSTYLNAVTNDATHWLRM